MAEAKGESRPAAPAQARSSADADASASGTAPKASGSSWGNKWRGFLNRNQDKLDSVNRGFDSVGKSIAGLWVKMTSDEAAVDALTPEALGLVYLTPRIIRKSM